MDPDETKEKEVPRGGAAGDSADGSSSSGDEAAAGAAAAGAQRKRARRAVGGGDVRAAAPGFWGATRARFQHAANLVALARRAEAVRDDASLAAVLAALLQAQSAAALDPVFYWRKGAREPRARLAEALLAGVRLLRRRPGAATYVQLKGCLRHARRLQATPAGRAAVDLALARLMLEEGQPGEAHDLLAGAREPAGEAAEFARLALMAEVRAAQWAAAMGAAAAPSGAAAGASQAALGSVASQPAATQIRCDLWAPTAALWARAGRGARQLAQDAEAHAAAALALRPGATGLAVAVAQLQAAQGHGGDALRTAREQAARAPRDADAHGLALLLLLSAPALTDATAAEAAKHARGLLEADPSCEEAARALTDLAERPELACAAPVLDGLAFFLDATPPTLQPEELTLRAWRVFAAAVRGQAAALSAALATAEAAESDLRAARLGDAGGEELETAAQRMRRAAQELDAAEAQWGAACATLERRAWWNACHLRLPLEAPAAAALVRSGAAATDALVALGAANAALHVALKRRRLAALRRAEAGLEDACVDRAAAGVAAVEGALREAGNAAAADELARYMEVLAAVLVAEDTRAKRHAVVFAAAASRALRAEDEARARGGGGRRSPVAGWAPVPLGAPHPALGPITQLPAAFWRAFPPARRRGHAGGAAPAAEPAAELATEPAAEDAARPRVRFTLPTQSD
jgi:hypothetical protein